MKGLRIVPLLAYVALCGFLYMAGSFIANPVARPIYSYSQEVFYAGDATDMNMYGVLNGTNSLEIPLSGNAAFFVLPSHFLSHATQWLVEYNENIHIQEYRQFNGGNVEPGTEGADTTKTLIVLTVGDYRGPVVFHYRDYQRGDIRLSANLIREAAHES